MRMIGLRTPQALAIGPRIADAMARDDLDGAATAIQEALVHEPRNAALRAFLGEVAYRQGNHQAALASWLASVALAPSLRDGWYGAHVALQAKVPELAASLAAMSDVLLWEAARGRITDESGERLRAALDVVGLLRALRQPDLDDAARARWLLAALNGLRAGLADLPAVPDADTAIAELPALDPESRTVSALMVQFYVVGLRTQPDRLRLQASLLDAARRAGLDVPVAVHLGLKAMELRLVDAMPDVVMNGANAAAPLDAYLAVFLAWLHTAERQLRPVGAYYRFQAETVRRAAEACRPALLPSPMVDTHRPIRRIAILAGQLRRPVQHSATNITLDLARALSAQQGVAVSVHVTDKYRVIPAPSFAERFSSTWRDGGDSSVAAAEHVGWLRGADVPIAYRSADGTLEDTVAAMARDVLATCPDVVVAIACQWDLVSDLLYDRLPVVAMPLFDSVYVDRADIHLCPFPVEDAGRAFRDLGLDDAATERYRKFSLGLALPMPLREHRRAEYGLPGDAVAYVTVGTRLAQDLAPDFVAAIAGFLRRRRNAVWVLIGPPPRDALAATCPELVGSQILLHGYEPDLAGFYATCDALLNPRRRGGGFAAAIAMGRGMPVLTMADPLSDTSVYVGAERAAPDIDAFVATLERWHADPGERAREGAAQKRRITEEFGLPGAVARLLGHAQEARESFARRIAGR